MLLKFLFSVILTGILFSPTPVFADDTCCVGHGGDYACDYSTSQLYCGDHTVSAACTCHAAPTATPMPTAIPTATPALPSTPSCPANASFSVSYDACTCSAGYIVSNNACVAYADYCRSQYGNNASFDASTKACSCATGYTWNSKGTQCISMDGVCNEKLGSQSYYNSTNDSCHCYDGYIIQDGQCQVVPTESITPAPTTSIPVVINTPEPKPTLADVIIPRTTPTKAPVKKVLASFDYHKKVPGLNGFIAVKKKHNGFLADFFNSLWEALKRALNI